MVIFHSFPMKNGDFPSFFGRFTRPGQNFIDLQRSESATAIKWVPLVSTIYGYDSTHAVVDIYIYVCNVNVNVNVM